MADSWRALQRDLQQKYPDYSSSQLNDLLHTIWYTPEYKKEWMAEYKYKTYKQLADDPEVKNYKSKGYQPPSDVEIKPRPKKLSKTQKNPPPLKRPPNPIAKKKVIVEDDASDSDHSNDDSPQHSSVSEKNYRAKYYQLKAKLEK